MANIDIQRKEAPIWPWLVGLLALALLIWAAFSLLGRDGAADPIAVTDPAPITATEEFAAPAAAPGAVQSYIERCSPRDPQVMGLDHEYTSSCIRQLADGIEAVVQERALTGVQVQDQLQQARQSADRLSASGPEETQHSALARDGFQALAQAMNTVQSAHYSQLGAQLTQLESTAASVDPGTNLLDQSQTVQRFFEQAGEALNTMATTPPQA